MKTAAANGGFIINITAPDQIVRNRSASGSSFDHCTYATSLGLLDFCIGMHTITGPRLERTPWYTYVVDRGQCRNQ